MDINDLIVKNLETAIEESGRTKTAIAEDAGITFTTLSRIVNKVNRLNSVSTLYGLSQSLRKPIGYFFGEKYAVLDDDAQLIMSKLEMLPVGFKKSINKEIDDRLDAIRYTVSKTLDAINIVEPHKSQVLVMILSSRSIDDVCNYLEKNCFFDEGMKNVVTELVHEMV